MPFLPLLLLHLLYFEIVVLYLGINFGWWDSVSPKTRVLSFTLQNMPVFQGTKFQEFEANS